MQTRLRILVTGAGGLIGSEVVRALRLTTVETIAVTRTSAPLAMHAHASWVTLDLRSDESIAALTALRPDIIIHAAAVVPRRFDDDEDRLAAEENRAIDDVVIAAAKSMRARLIYLSTTSLYGCVQTTCTENSPITPRGAYGGEKRRSETIVLNLDPVATVLRVSAPYGPRQRWITVLQKFVRQAVRGDDLLYYGSGEREQDFTAVNDVAAAVVAAVPLHSSGIYNIASGKPITMRALATLVIDTVGSDQSRARSAGVDDPEEGCRARIAIARAEGELDWHPVVPLKDGIRELAACLDAGSARQGSER